MDKEARLFAVLSDPARLEILDALSKKKGCVSELQIKTGRNQPNISQHLRVLRDSGLVEARKEGRRVCYSVCRPEVKGLLELAKRID
ncbi:MAG: metalloregulator ArsR/SmtB family transcription factor [Candidatus Micrarchaeia archaeon]